MAPQSTTPSPLAADQLAAIGFLRAGWALVVVDAQSHLVVAANPAAEALYGYPLPELVGLAIDALFAPEERVHLPTYRAQVHGTGRAAYASVHLRRDGSQFAADVIVTADYDEAGAARYRIVSVRAIA